MARAESGLTIFVPLSAPGDRVRVKIVEHRRRFARAEITEMLEPGPGRVAPLCDFFGHCGGCAWQHLDYRTQVEAKQRIIYDALERIAGQRLRGKVEFTPSPIEYGYRVRARVLEDSGGFGYRERASHTLCAVDRCPVLVPELQSEFTRLRQAVTDADTNRKSTEPFPREWELVAGANGIARSTRLPHRDPPQGESVVSDCQFEVDGKRLSISPGSFVQANGAMHEILYRAVLEAVGEGDRILELHAGVGFFTVGLVDRFAHVDAVESAKPAVVDLRRNLKPSKGGRVRILAAPAEAVLPGEVAQAPDVVLVDPPRTGLSLPLLEGIASLQPRRIVYLSCDPATLARDLARFADRGHRTRRVQGFDLFPQTPHVEILASLRVE